jgi:predicted unusual protein kinase regulating ubiquinone biosynthesis (AarF/ABC1/UbiB family)
MPTISELLEALPADEEFVQEAPDQLEVLSSLSQRPVPIGALRRLWSLGGLHARVGLAYMAYWMRTYFKDADDRDRDRMETHLRAAVKVLNTMGYLRGAVMKIGQLAASLPEIVPDEFVTTLSRLHFEAPPMHFSLLREHVHDELGGDPEEIFAEFEKRAFAAASLGQVHRARLKTGQPVAIKIQYPGIARTIRSDFRNLSAVLLPLRFSRDWENLKSQFEELRSVMETETDYEHEAEMQRRVRRLFTEDEGIVIPRVYDEYSTRRVLTMEYLDGQTINEFQGSNPTQELRNHYGRLICRSFSRILFKERMLYADPHPGNVLFLDDGRLGLIDFGCMREWNDDEWEYMRGADEALVEFSDEAIVAHIRRGVELTEEQLNNTELMRLMVDYCRWIWEPLAYDVEFDCGNSEYIRRGVDIAMAFTKIAHPAQKPLNVFIQRSFFAGWGLQHRLKSCFNGKRILDDEVRAAGWPHRN